MPVPAGSRQLVQRKPEKIPSGCGGILPRNREFRYVRFYTRYGRNGYEVLEGYIEWLSSNSPDTWSRKKKYNYGNVLNMPMEDYINLILREAKKNRGQTAKRLSEETEEPLTVTEIIVLKELSTGMTKRKSVRI